VLSKRPYGEIRVCPKGFRLVLRRFALENRRSRCPAANKKNTMRVLFVCMGNICRSPSAEGVFRKAIANSGCESIQFDSAGTHDYHVGDPPDRRAIAAAKRRGIDLSDLRARSIEDGDFAEFDLVLAMDCDNLDILQRRAPAQFQERIKLVMDFAPLAYSREVPDPYYGGAQGFEDVLNLLELAAQGLLRELRVAV
jgi:protein-tyrosine phosphatase